MTFTIGWPQGIYLLMTLVGLVVAVLEHGKPRKPSNVWVSLLATVIIYALLIWGGFFS